VNHFASAEFWHHYRQLPDEGGQIVAQGTPEYIARQEHSATGRFLAAALAQEMQDQPT
jgi:hypothetical protein